MENFAIHVTQHSDNTKMAGIQSIGTTSLVNPICQRRKEVCGGICSHCYAANLCKMRASLNQHLAKNYEKLTAKLLSPTEAAAVPVTSLIARIESFGDVANVTQARNYIRIIRAHKWIQFGIWSKNWGIWHAAFKKEGKPRNCTYVHSSMNVNSADWVHPFMQKYVDHVFTVWDKTLYPQVIAANPASECAGLSCAKCQKCYHKGGSYYINERLR
jgi:hypothetical protein